MGKDAAEDVDTEGLDEQAASMALAGWVTQIGFVHYLVSTVPDY